MNRAPKYIVETVWTAELPKELSNSYLTSRDQQLPRVIYPDIRVLTANKGTHNDTFYPEESLRGDPERGTGLISFNRPYAIPILRDHLDTPSPDGRHSSEVYGRIYHPAQIHSNGNEKYLRCMATITHPEAIEAILTGRWLTVSLGSKTESVRCSICKGELTEGLCDHQKGKMYELTDTEGSKEKCRWVIGPIRAREVSFVVSPSDDQAGIISPNLNESIREASLVMPRLLVGDDRGIFDLSTGRQVAETELFSRPSPGRMFGGLTLLGSSVSLKEDHSTITPPRLGRTEPQTEEEVSRWMKEDFIGPGKYLLSGWDHDHTVVLDQRGDGTSSPSQMPPTQFQSPGYMYPTMSAEALGGTGPAKGRAVGDGAQDPVQTGDMEDHTHEVLGGRVMKAGYPTHSHDMEPAHAALEIEMPTKNKTEVSVETPPNPEEETPLTLGVLYNLPESDPEYLTPDTAEESKTEAKLSTKARNALDSTAFCGPDRSFPAHDRAHVTAGLRLLNRSNYSADQKARIHGCLSGRAKKYGIQVGGQEAFAARLMDTNHHMEFGLYRMPADLAQTEELLAKVKSMPHTPTEKEAILSRIASYCKDVLPVSSWQHCFGDLTTCEAGEPVEIQINAENYGLLYTLSSAAVPMKQAETSVTEDKEADPSVEEAAQQSEDPEANTDAQIAETDSGLPLVALPKQLETKDATRMTNGDPASDIVRETMLSLQTRLNESDQQARFALAHSVALYAKSLRKPFTRSKTSEQLIEMLATRTADSLRDTLSDLLLELEAGVVTNPQPLPKLNDPTGETEVLTEATPKESANTAQDVAADTQVTERQTDSSRSSAGKNRQSMLAKLTAIELPDEEETYSVLGYMFDKLKVAPNK